MPHFYGLCRGIEIRLAHALAMVIVIQVCLFSQQVDSYQDGVSMFPRSDQPSKGMTMLVPYTMPRSSVKHDQRQFALQAGQSVELIYGEGI